MDIPLHKGILVSGQEPELLQDIVNLGCKQAICNLASYQNVNSFDPLAQTCRANGITMTMILLNNFGGNPDLLPVSSPVEGTGNYAFNVSRGSGGPLLREKSGQSLCVHCVQLGHRQ